MAKKRGARVGAQRRPAAAKAPRQPARGGAAPAGSGAADALEIPTILILAAVLLGTSLAVDTSAAAAFDAPKRAIALAGVALAAALGILASAIRRGPSWPPRAWTDASSVRRAAFALGAAALAGALLSALLSPRRAMSLDAMRSVTLLAALIPLGASDAVARGRAWLTGAFLGACAVNAVVSILQGLGRWQPFALETAGTRQDTGAFAGNVGYLAIALALASVAACAILLAAKRPAFRLLAAAALGLFAADLLVNRNLTALSAAVAGVAALLLVRFRRRAALPLLGAVAAAALLLAAYPPLRERARTDWVLLRVGDWNALLSYRGGPWAAAGQMARERPLLGFGPGTFAAEYVPHRLAAEIHARRRFLSPMLTSSYGETHNDYLQAMSDAGIPVALLAAAAAGCLLAATARSAGAGSTSKRPDPEPALLFAVLVAGAVAALTWFPLQRPITAVPLLLAAGRAWRVSAGGSDSADEEDAKNAPVPEDAP